MARESTHTTPSDGAREGFDPPPAPSPRGCLLLSSAPDETTAKRLARSLVEEGVVACVSCIPGATSVYRWKGVVEESREVILLAKLPRDATVRAIARLTELHPYECPEALVFDADEGAPPYLRWLVDSVPDPTSPSASTSAQQSLSRDTDTARDTTPSEVQEP